MPMDAALRVPDGMDYIDATDYIFLVKIGDWH